MERDTGFVIFIISSVFNSDFILYEEVTMLYIYIPIIKEVIIKLVTMFVYCITVSN